MEKIDLIRSRWMKALSQMEESPGFQILKTGKLSRDIYASVLIEIYHQVKMHPPALASMSLRIGAPADVLRSLLKHALSEIGHDELALSDLKALGIAELPVGRQQALPET